MINIDGVAIELRPRPFFQKALILSLSLSLWGPRSDRAIPFYPLPSKKRTSVWRFGLDLPNIKILAKFLVVTITPLPISQTGGFAYFAR